MRALFVRNFLEYCEIPAECFSRLIGKPDNYISELCKADDDTDHFTEKVFYELYQVAKQTADPKGQWNKIVKKMKPRLRRMKETFVTYFDAVSSRHMQEFLKATDLQLLDFYYLCKSWYLGEFNLSAVNFYLRKLEAEPGACDYFSEHTSAIVRKGMRKVLDIRDADLSNGSIVYTLIPLTGFELKKLLWKKKMPLHSLADGMKYPYSALYQILQQYDREDLPHEFKSKVLEYLFEVFPSVKKSYIDDLILKQETLKS